jgi:hypothetical protein
MGATYPFVCAKGPGPGLIHKRINVVFPSFPNARKGGRILARRAAAIIVLEHFLGGIVTFAAPVARLRLEPGRRRGGRPPLPWRSGGRAHSLRGHALFCFVSCGLSRWTIRASCVNLQGSRYDERRSTDDTMSFRCVMSDEGREVVAAPTLPESTRQHTHTKAESVSLECVGNDKRESRTMESTRLVSPFFFLRSKATRVARARCALLIVVVVSPRNKAKISPSYWTMMAGPARTRCSLTPCTNANT